MDFVEQKEGETLVDHLMRNHRALGLNPGHLAQLRHAQRLQRGNRRERQEAERIGRAVSLDAAELPAQVLANEADHTPDDGAAVVPFNDAGAVRLRSRDELFALHNAGSITRTEFEVGLIYRGHYERLGKSCGSQLADHQGGRGGGSPDNDRKVWAALDDAKAAQAITRFEAAVVEAARGDPVRRGSHELRALRLVAGEGRTLRSFANGGVLKAQALAALSRALTAIVRAERGPQNGH